MFALAWSVVVLSVGAISLLYWLLRHGAASNVARLFFLVPAVTAVMAYLVFGETLDALAIAGMVLIAVGVALARPRRCRPLAGHEASAGDPIVQELPVGIDERPQEIERDAARVAMRAAPCGRSTKIAGERERGPDPAAQIAREGDAAIDDARRHAGRVRCATSSSAACGGRRPRCDEVDRARAEHDGKRKRARRRIGDAQCVADLRAAPAAA